MNYTNKEEDKETNWFFVVGVIFLILKMAHVIDWSWWIIGIPFIPSVITLCMNIGFCCYIFIHDKRHHIK